MRSARLAACSASEYWPRYSWHTQLRKKVTGTGRVRVGVRVRARVRVRAGVRDRAGVRVRVRVRVGIPQQPQVV